MRQILFILLWIAVGCKAWATPVPQSTATRFCQLLVQDAAGNIKSLNAFANGDAPLFAEYVFQHDGWHDLRIFPHGDRWYAATDILPSSLDHEHQRYIQEVFPRMIHEAEAGHWDVVDEYIDRLLQYQRQFSNTKQASSISSPIPVTLLLALLFLLFLLVPLLQYNASDKKLQSRTDDLSPVLHLGR